jgi:hypothetical protein
MSERSERTTSPAEPSAAPGPGVGVDGAEESATAEFFPTSKTPDSIAEPEMSGTPGTDEKSGATDESGTVGASGRSVLAEHPDSGARPRSGSVGDRYGRTSTRRRWVLPTLSVGVVVLGLIIAYIGYKQFGPKDIDPQQLGYSVINDSTIEAHFKVTRTHPERAAYCFVRAMDSNGGEVGRREVLIAPSSSGTVELKTIVRSVARPAATDIYGCGGIVPAYLRAG